MIWFVDDIPQCFRLREDMKTQSVELVALQSRCKELQISLSEIQSKQLPIELELTKALREKEVAESKAGFLEGEMRKIEMERTEGRAESIQKLKALEHQVATLKAEAAEHAKHAQAMKVEQLIVCLVHVSGSRGHPVGEDRVLLAQAERGGGKARRQSGLFRAGA